MKNVRSPVSASLFDSIFANISTDITMHEDKEKFCRIYFYRKTRKHYNEKRSILFQLKVYSPSNNFQSRFSRMKNLFAWENIFRESNFIFCAAKNGQPISGTAANFKQQRMENDFCERDYTLNLLAYFNVNPNS